MNDYIKNILSGYVEIYRMNEKLFDYDIIKKFKVGEEEEENV